MAGRAKQNYAASNVGAIQQRCATEDKVDQLQTRVLSLNDRVTSLERELSRTQERIQVDINNLVTIINEMKNNDPNNPHKTFSG
jgi:chaperonin cofactor prefoldin